VDVPYYLSKYDPDPLRFYLTATASETRDTEACPEGLVGLSWEDLVDHHNPVLSANEGNDVRATHISVWAIAWTILRIRYIIGAEVARLPESGAETLDSQVDKIPDSTPWRKRKVAFYGNQSSPKT
jgi:hypothetical protein